MREALVRVALIVLERVVGLGASDPIQFGEFIIPWAASHPPAHRDKAAMNGTQLFVGSLQVLMSGPPAYAAA
jgi:hypothetical protein